MDTSTTLQIAVASKNPVKAAAIESAFQQLFPDQPFQTGMYPAASDVADQPMSDDETRRGAFNRVADVRRRTPTADLWAGLEGGVEEDEFGMRAFAWIVIESNELRGCARTATFPLPETVAALVRNGMELGHADDVVFGRRSSKTKEGAIGILTNGLVDRRQLYEHAAIMAMIPWRKTESVRNGSRGS